MEETLDEVLSEGESQSTDLSEEELQHDTVTSLRQFLENSRAYDRLSRRRRSEGSRYHKS